MTGLLARRHSGPDAAGRAALVALLDSPTVELLPLKSAAAQIEFLPGGATVAVTASPAKGLAATVALAESLVARGFRAVPHLSARMVRDRAELRDLLARIRDAGIGRIFVVGGDEEEPGPYPDGLSLLREIADLGLAPAETGIPCYPDGHAFIGEDALLEALHAKAAFAAYMTTQLCFDPAKVDAWVRARRADGLALPVHIGVPGVTEPQRLLTISARIGVRDTKRFVAKNLGFVARLARSGGFYRPDRFLAGLAPLAADPGAGVADLHLYTFNAVEPTEAWRRVFLERLRRDA
jgi:methylenetetrahydrofolate reductase (NADPH)